MRRAVLLTLLIAAAAAAQAPESIEAWRWFKTVGTAGVGQSSILLDPEVLAAARPDGADLRLFAGDREIPYALRVRREIHSSEAFQAREFNRAERGSTAVLSLDLGPTPAEHNAVEVATAGMNFRRRVAVEGSPDGEEWFELVDNRLLFRFAARGTEAEEQIVEYPPSRFRYLRVSVEADPAKERVAPTIRQATVRRVVESAGELLPFPAEAIEREPAREEGRAASTYRIRLPGRLPLSALEVQTSETAFSRPFRLWTAEPPEHTGFVVAGTLRRSEREPEPARIELDEIFAEELELTIIDDRNPPLPIEGVIGWSAAREVYFERDPAAAGELRLYYGNPRAASPNYDYGDRLAAAPPPGSRLPLGPQQTNPEYEPQEPLTERTPWLLYVGLAGAAAALFLILRNLLKAESTESAS